MLLLPPIKQKEFQRKFDISFFSLHYLLVRICIYKDTGLYLSSYQQKVRKLLDNLGAKERNCTVQFAGNFAGKLTVSQLNEIADRLLAGLDYYPTFMPDLILLLTEKENCLGLFNFVYI